MYHEVFARFRVKFNDLPTQIPSEVYANVTQLFGASQIVYDLEKSRIRAIGPYREKLMDNKYISQSVTGAEADGVVITATPGRPTAYRAFLEMKNEIGTGGCDPVAQGVKCYEKFWAAEEVRNIDPLVIFFFAVFETAI